jgi:hypothetical protein
VGVVGRFLAGLARIQNPDRALLPEAERLAVLGQRQDPVGARDVLVGKPAAIAVEGPDRKFDARGLYGAEHVAQQRTAEGGGLVEFRRLDRHGPLLQAEQHGAVELVGGFEIDILTRELAVALFVERPAVRLSDHAANREDHHVSRLRRLGRGNTAPGGKRDTDSKRHAQHRVAPYGFSTRPA